mmetsp:Transcript_31778/g.62047  ORF Transcript_31778/g.62047 Transcript_31778/m.62047 type:complete len:203 (+) Transcript_31778:1930-2538(+)
MRSQGTRAIRARSATCAPSTTTARGGPRPTSSGAPPASRRRRACQPRRSAWIRTPRAPLPTPRSCLGARAAAVAAFGATFRRVRLACSAPPAATVRGGTCVRRARPTPTRRGGLPLPRAASATQGTMSTRPAPAASASQASGALAGRSTPARRTRAAPRGPSRRRGAPPSPGTAHPPACRLCPARWGGGATRPARSTRAPRA